MLKCSCGGSLEEGFIPDFGMFATWVSVWFPGEPSTLKGVLDRIKTGAGIATESKDAKMVEALRCQTCGKLDLYARMPPPFGAAVG